MCRCRGCGPPAPPLLLAAGGLWARQLCTRLPGAVDLSFAQDLECQSNRCTEIVDRLATTLVQIQIRRVVLSALCCALRRASPHGLRRTLPPTTPPTNRHAACCAVRPSAALSWPCRRHRQGLPRRHGWARLLLLLPLARGHRTTVGGAPLAACVIGVWATVTQQQVPGRRGQCTRCHAHVLAAPDARVHIRIRRSSAVPLAIGGGQLAPALI